jgi:nucleoside-diphosphate-sugar epimerase
VTTEKHPTVKKVLVTGASGFVGSHVCDSLVNSGWQVRCLVRSTSNRRWLEHLPVEYVLGDVSGKSDLNAACDGCEAVVHSAGVTNAASKEEYFETNARGTERVWKAAERAGVKRFLQVSSLAAAGPSPVDSPQDESVEPHPVNAYGKSKLEGERIVLGAPGSMEVVVVRPPAVYGPRDSAVLTMVQAALRGLMPLPLTGKRQVSMIYALDLAEGIRLALEKGRPGGVFFMTDGQVYTVPEIAGIIGRVIGRPVRTLALPGFVWWLAALGGDVANRILTRPVPINLERLKQLRRDGWTADDSRARSELGYHSPFDVARGMEETIRWYRSVGWI